MHKELVSLNHGDMLVQSTASAAMSLAPLTSPSQRFTQDEIALLSAATEYHGLTVS